MASRHDKRRRSFFGSGNGPEGFTVLTQNDGDDEVLVAPQRVRLRDPAAWPDFERLTKKRLRSLRHADGVVTWDGPDDAEDGVDPIELTQVLDDHREIVGPEYVLIAQQRAQPAEDPELSLEPLPPVDHRRLALGRGVKIAIVDTGVADQPGARDVWSSGQGSRKSFDPLKDSRPQYSKYLAWAAGHATFIASLIRQVAPGTTIVPIRAASPMGFEPASAMAAGVVEAIEQNVDIINLSWGMYSVEQDEPAPENSPGLAELHAAIQHAVKRNIAVVAAAGNSESTDPMYPAAWPDVTAVAALDAVGRQWSGTNYGEWVNVSVLGVRLRGVYVAGRENPVNEPDGQPESWTSRIINYAEWTGTSFAAPLVAAQIAVVQSDMGPETSALAARDALLTCAYPARDPGCGKRIVVDLPGQT